MAGGAKFLKSAFRRDHWPAADRPEVAFVGRSNVGKSSCLNTITGQRGLARVSKTPGRTQAINFFELSLGGRDVRYADLPGYGFAKVPASVKRGWDQMIGTYLAEREDLRLVVVLVDLRRDPTDLDRRMIQWLADTDRAGLLVLTKADRISKNKRLNRQSLICKGLGVPREASVLFSSPERMGVKELISRLREATA
jgi:GTP-binding protein